MQKDLVLQLKYVGVIPQRGFREYSFTIESKDKTVREVVLTIDDGVFMENQLMFQEAPDLCYQKLLADMESETPDVPISSRASVTPSEIAFYRDTHPLGKQRHRPQAKHSDPERI